jgi:hypothetical protein
MKALKTVFFVVFLSIAFICCASNKTESVEQTATSSVTGSTAQESSATETSIVENATPTNDSNDAGWQK